MPVALRATVSSIYFFSHLYQQLHLQSQSVNHFKSAAHTALNELISCCVQSVHMWEMDHLLTWCCQNNFQLNALKALEMGLKSQQKNTVQLSLIIEGSPPTPPPPSTDREILEEN